MHFAQYQPPCTPHGPILIATPHQRPAPAATRTRVVDAGPASGPHLLAMSVIHAGLARRWRLGVTMRAALVVLMIGLTLWAQPVLAQGAQGELPVPQPRLPMVELTAGMHLIRAELAEDPGTRARGLMMRERLGNNEGMLFVFPEKAGHCFWMRNTLIALSIAFLDDDGTIVNIADMNPRSEQSHCPAKPIRFALEMERGWFATRGLSAGMKLSAPRVFRIQPRQ